MTNIFAHLINTFLYVGMLGFVPALIAVVCIFDYKNK